MSAWVRFEPGARVLSRAEIGEAYWLIQVSTAKSEEPALGHWWLSNVQFCCRVAG